jgi:cellulose synthase/poly-beta-1,6-N-acetylglucosamine synthase-like glycosyltransferase
VLNDVIPQCRGEIVALGDARQRYDPGALRALVENFADRTVGAVSGELHLVAHGASTVGEGIGFYWRYEKFIRRQESRLDSTVGVTGAIYALRRDQFEAIPPDTLLDDVLIPLNLARRGYRVVFEPEAAAFDEVSPTGREEFTRKVRTIAGNAQLLGGEAWLWRPGQNRLWFQLLSHKGLRLLSPVLLAAAFVSSTFLAAVDPFYAVLFGVQALFYTSAAAGVSLGRVPGLGRWLGLPYAFCLLNVTAVIGVLRYLTGRQRVTWRTAVERAGGRFAQDAGKP